MARAAAAVVEATAAAEDTPTGTTADMATALNFVTMIGHTPLMEAVAVAMVAAVATQMAAQMATAEVDMAAAEVAAVTV